MTNLRFDQAAPDQVIFLRFRRRQQRYEVLVAREEVDRFEQLRPRRLPLVDLHRCRQAYKWIARVVVFKLLMRENDSSIDYFSCGDF